MNRLQAVFSLLFLISFSMVFSQQSVNSFKYVIVPEQYEFQKMPDQYQVNSLTIFLFEKAGFEVLSSKSTYPEDLAKNPCLALKGVVKNSSNFLITKLNVALIDCYNTTIFETPEEKSKIKDYKKSYQEAIRKAFDTIQQLNYKYNGDTPRKTTPVVVAEEVAAPVATAAVVAEENVPPPAKKEVVEEEVAPLPIEEDVVVEATEEVIETEVATSNSQIEVPETVTTDVPAQKMAVAASVALETAQPTIEAAVPITNYSIEGTYMIDVWGTCTIVKKGDEYAVIGGDEDFQFATIYTTSKPTIFMIKKTGFSQMQLLEINGDGDLQMDVDDTVKIYNRVE